MFALKRTSLGSGLDCVAPCLEESLLSLAKLRLEEVWKSFTEHTKRVDVCSGAILAPEPLGRVPFSTTRAFETLFFFELKE